MCKAAGRNWLTEGRPVYTAGDHQVYWTAVCWWSSGLLDSDQRGLLVMQSGRRLTTDWEHDLNPPALL